MKFNERLKELRLKKDVTQTVVAEAVHVSQRVYSNYECGSVQPNLGTLIALADYFKVSIDYLLGRSNNKKMLK